MNKNIKILKFAGETVFINKQCTVYVIKKPVNSYSVHGVSNVTLDTNMLTAI